MSHSDRSNSSPWSDNCIQLTVIFVLEDPPVSEPESSPPTRETLATLIAQANMQPGPEQFEEMYDAFLHLSAMVKRLHTHFAMGDEPAHVFTPVKF